MSMGGIQDRWYQLAAVDAFEDFIDRGGKSGVVVIPTGGGKSVVLGKIGLVLRKRRRRALIITHVGELVKQDRDAIIRVDPRLRVGIHSAFVGRRDFKGDLIVGGIHSMWRHAEKFGHIDDIFVDECQMVSRDVKMYSTLLEKLRAINPNLVLTGMTATPGRHNQGHLCAPGPNGEEPLFEEVIFRVGIKALIQEGYLSPIITPSAGNHMAGVGNVRITGGDFNSGDLEKFATEEEVVEGCIAEAVRLGSDRRKWLTFVTGKHHAEMMCAGLNAAGIQSEICTDDTPKAKREKLVADLRAGRLRNLINIKVFTTGFDVPDLDCILDCSPTMSVVLHAQKLGRGTRVDPAGIKKNCLLIDTASNLYRHGGIDRVDERFAEVFTVKKGAKKKEPSKVRCCEKCNYLYDSRLKQCPECGTLYKGKGFTIDRFTKHAADGDVITGVPRPAPGQNLVDVFNVRYDIHVKPDRQYPTLRVDYETEVGTVRAWKCFSHPRGSHPRSLAIAWFERNAPPRTPQPRSVEEALQAIAEADYFDRPEQLLIERTAEGYHKILGEIAKKRDDLVP